MLCGVGLAQQFRISSITNGEMVIEYPPSFDGAYLFVNASSNLMGGTWEAVDYTQVELMEVAGSGEIQNDSSSAGSIWNSAMEGDHGFFRISAISFVDTDGDGVDNVTEYGAGTNPFINDAPQIQLPDDDGDPRPVPGSVNSAPGDWNAPPQTVFRSNNGLYKEINNRILALTGTKGSFTAESTIAELGAWIESMCGTWRASDWLFDNGTHPIVDNGSFYRTETNGFTWVGKENIYALAFYPYDGSEEFYNHLVQSDPADPAGLARFPDGTPVLINGDNPWTEAKIRACLPHLITVRCRLQRGVYEGTWPSLVCVGYDETDTNALAKGETQYNADALQPFSGKDPNAVAYYDYRWKWQYDDWYLEKVSDASYNTRYTFLSNLTDDGFGITTHRGYYGLIGPHDWTDSGQWDKYTLQPSLPEGLQVDVINQTFTCVDGDAAWIFAGDANYGYWRTPPDVEDLPPYPFYQASALNRVGFMGYAKKVLSTLSPPHVSEYSTLIMDCDRDGRITESNDWNRVDQNHPFRFWVNEDGSSAAYPEADLEDFFPAQIHWPDGEGMSNLTFKLSANVDMDYIPTSMMTNNTDAYLTELNTAATLAGNITTLSSGMQTAQTFNENDIVLLAANEANTNAQIYMHILQDGVEIEIATNYFSFSLVESMYRIKNLRSGGINSTNQPANWPDELTNGRDFVFVHGYNVTEAAGREWNKTIFKRLWHSGSNARYHAVLWDGTPPAGGDKKHYHNAVVNAFATAPALAAYLNGLSEPIVAAHSLGNMVASSAICDHGANVSQYYMLDAAVAKEAYGDTAPNEEMIPDGSFIYNQDEGMFSLIGYKWQEYPPETWASEWYRLFDSSDARSRLTWRHRFADLQQKTDAFNFYSSSEEVLRVDTGYTSLISGFIDGNFKLYAFQLQELYKGKNDWFAIAAGGGSDPYLGWGFTTESDTHIISTPLLDIDFWPRSPRFHHEQLDTAAANVSVRSTFREKLKTDPVFRPEPEILFSDEAEFFAGATVGTCGFTFNYDLPNATVNIANVSVRDYLLAKAFPSRTGPLGSRGNSMWPPTTANFDMSSEYMTNPAGWPHKEDNIAKWWHSDIRDVPYVHNYSFFDTITAQERN